MATTLYIQKIGNGKGNIVKIIADYDNKLTVQNTRTKFRFSISAFNFWTHYKLFKRKPVKMRRHPVKRR
jgi:hypothetical protein